MKSLKEDVASYKYVKVQEKRLDIRSVSCLKRELFFLIQNQGYKNIILDISNCSFCDASGLGAIVKVHFMCNTAGGKLILTGIHSNIEKLIKICMLHTVWRIAKEISDVDTMLKSSA